MILWIWSFIADRLAAGRWERATPHFLTRGRFANVRVGLQAGVIRKYQKENNAGLGRLAPSGSRGKEQRFRLARSASWKAPEGELWLFLEGRSEALVVGAAAGAGYAGAGGGVGVGFDGAGEGGDFFVGCGSGVGLGGWLFG